MRNRAWCRTIPLALSALAAALSLSCAVLEQVGFQKPDVDVSDARVTDVDLRALDLVFDLEVDNPNPFGLALSRVGYELEVAGSTFLTGDEPKGLTIPARGAESFDLPLSLSFERLFEAYRNLRDARRTDYQLRADLWFDVPVVGPVRVPVTKDGQIPLTRPR